MDVKESWFQQERLNSILEMISYSGRVTVKELSEAFNISLVTIRKDLKQLEKEGRVVRTHGGAISSEEISNHVPFEKEKSKTWKKNKDRRKSCFICFFRRSYFYRGKYNYC